MKYPSDIGNYQHTFVTEAPDGGCINTTCGCEGGAGWGAGIKIGCGTATGTGW